MDPTNGASWFISTSGPKTPDDAVAIRDLQGIADSRQFDTYWNATIVHVTSAIVKTNTTNLATAFLTTIGVVSAVAIPAYQPIVNACKGESLKEPSILETCRQVAGVMRNGDTYITELIGMAIAKKTWPQESAEYLDAVDARRDAYYRIKMEAKIGSNDMLGAKYVAARLRLMTESRTEQEVISTEIEHAKLNPNPPDGWTYQ